ncbi:MAG: recombinase zinc beta ribbon domain-containing protein [Armatimonadetes bacterium]|nr:recombinase zinc beta ribbon domain-containing protein [Armatimonadota bacterium]
MVARKSRTFSPSVKTSNRACSSPYLLSGGMFGCSRCGGNMVGFYKQRDEQYYICNSVPNRRGLGCGQGVYVPQGEIEREVFTGLESLLGVCSDGRDFVREVNSELRRIWEQSHGYDPNAAKRLGDIETKIGNIRQSIEDGLEDTTWANARLRELVKEQQSLSALATVQENVPQIDLQTAMAYRSDAARVIVQGTNAEKKRLLSAWIDKIELAPESLEVEIRYKIPEPVVDRMGAGEGFEPSTFGL